MGSSNLAETREFPGGTRWDHLSMGDLQDPTDWRYVNVPYFWPYFGRLSPEI